jgi:hypothetical protein
MVGYTVRIKKARNVDITIYHTILEAKDLIGD